MNNHFRFHMGDFTNKGGYNHKSRYPLKDYHQKQRDTKPAIPSRYGYKRGNYYTSRFHLYHH